jgi:hypothetical protein
MLLGHTHRTLAFFNLAGWPSTLQAGLESELSFVEPDLGKALKGPWETGYDPILLVALGSAHGQATSPKIEALVLTLSLTTLIRNISCCPDQAEIFTTKAES